MESSFISIAWMCYVASEWIIRLVMLIVVPFRRSPEAAKGWLLALFFLPWPSLLLYWFIGRPKMPAWRALRFACLPKALEPIRRQLAELPQMVTPALAPSAQQAADLVLDLGHLGPLGGNSVQLLADYEGAVQQLVSDIDQAQHHVHLLYYIFADDATGQKVIDALGRATQRGVSCRVLADALGSRRWRNSLVAKFAALGVEMRLVLPVFWFRRHSARADLRNHRKIAVIDGHIGFTGSQNLVAADFKPGVTYQELVVRVTGPVVLELQAVFISDWYLETEQVLGCGKVFPSPSVPGDSITQVLPSGPDYPDMNVHLLIVALIHAARERVFITTPYFIPNDAFLQAMHTAALRGVEVHLLVSYVADQFFVSRAQRSYYAELLEKGVQIHVFRGRFLHAKHISIDGSIALIGTSNMDIRSFALNAEVTFACYDSKVVAQLRENQDCNLKQSDLLILDEWSRRPLRQKVVENIARLLSPLL